MDRQKKKTKFMRDQESYLRAKSFVMDARKRKEGLSREFLRVPYGLEVMNNAKDTGSVSNS